jgi:DNA mismatch repair protein MutH
LEGLGAIDRKDRFHLAALSSKPRAYMARIATAAHACTPPRDLRELEQRARALAGASLDELARAYGALDERASAHRKGTAGQLIERVLGATAGSRAAPDFVALGVELKTLPVDGWGRPKESTFICSFALTDVERADWSSSGLRAKLAHVLFVPLLEPPLARGAARRDEATKRTVGVPFFWRPSLEQESILRADFDDLVGLIALGNVEAVNARLGRWLQLRPKAAHGRVRTRALGRDGEHIATIPRGFYLRARVTRALLRDPRTVVYG